jgi:methionyl-tRNA formyltransferase
MDFGVTAIDALCDQGTPPALLVGYPPELGHRSGYASLVAVAERRCLPLLETADINDGRAYREVRDRAIDLLVVAGWSQLVRPPLLMACPRGAVGLHPTKLPQGRGRAPLPWTIITGMTASAVSLFFLDQGVDTGDIIAQVDFTISRRDDVTAVYDRVTRIHVELLRMYVPKLLNGTVTGKPQPDGGSEWPRRRPDDGVIDWHRPAAVVYDWIRALGRPYPGAFTTANGRRLYVHSADHVAGHVAGGAPGTVLAPVWSTATGGLLVACAESSLILREVQWDGGPRCDALALFECGELAVGTQLGGSDSRTGGAARAHRG